MASIYRQRGRGKRAAISGTEIVTPPVWPGVIGGCLKPLSEAEVSLVEESVLHLLETLGLSQAIPSMIKKVVAVGGSVTDEGRLLFPRQLVLKTIAEARRDIALYGQNPVHDIHLSGARVHMSSGGAAPGVFDIETGEYRDSTVKDLYDAARICDAMENIHHFSRSVVARDIEDNRVMDINWRSLDSI